jgi:hypothetical protein
MTDTSNPSESNYPAGWGRLTNEEQVAEVILNSVNDLTLDLAQVGIYLARGAHNLLYANLGQVILAANSLRPINGLEVEPLFVPESTPTSFFVRCEILQDLFLNRGKHPDLEDYFEYVDLGLPIAYLLHNDLIQVSEKTVTFVNEAFTLLLTSLEIDDEGFASLDEVFERAGYESETDGEKE